MKKMGKNFNKKKTEKDSVGTLNGNHVDSTVQKETSPNASAENELSKSHFFINTIPSFNIGEENTNKVQVNEEVEEDESTKVIVKKNIPLCADYRSEDSDSFDSESDSSSTFSSTTSDTISSEDEDDDEFIESENKKEDKKQKKNKLKTDLSLTDLPPIEDLKISVPEDFCCEIGTITSIVDPLVVVESYKGTAALDIGTVLFLENGKRALGKVFDILGPIWEPVYTIRFNNQEQIDDLNIKKGMKVYYAPKTQHTTFVFMSEVLKNKGSDASWKDNVEAPLEFQDFSDDEEEKKLKKEIPDEVGEMKNGNSRNNQPNFRNIPRKRAFHKTSSNYINNYINPRQGSMIRNQNPNQNSNSVPPQNITFNLRAPRLNLPSTFASGPPLNPYRIPAPTQPFPPAFTYNFPRVPNNNFVNPLPAPPPTYFFPRFSGPPFPTFGGPFPNQSPNFQNPYFQQRAHAPNEVFASPWRTMLLRPPPPPPTSDPSS